MPLSTSQEQRLLLDQVHRAELQQSGLVMDMGTPDQHKYTLGGWKTGWGHSRREAGVTYAELSREGMVTYGDRGPASYTLTIRARATSPGVKLAAVIAGRNVGSREVPTSWGVLELARISLKNPGRRKLYLLPRPAGATVQVQWIWLRTRTSGSGGAPDTRRLASFALQQRRRALVARRPTTYSFYLPIHSGAELVFEYGSRGPGRLEVSAISDDLSPLRLLSVDTSGRWTPARLSLASLAGEVVRLDFALTGQVGTTRDAAVAVAEPRLVRQVPRRTAPAITAANRAHNYIHVVVDAARQDAYRVFNRSARAQTPAVDALAQQGVIFTNAQVNDNHTLGSVPSMIAGRYGNRIGDSEDKSRTPLLAAHMRKNSVASAMITANPYLTSSFGLSRGQDHFRYHPMKGQNKQTRRVFSDALVWVAQRHRRGERFSLYIQTMDPHHPYRYHQAHTPRLLGRDLQGKTTPVGGPSPPGTKQHQRYVRALYTGEIEAHDVELARFVAGLRSMGVLDKTLLVYSSDHGEELYERGQNDHGTTLHEELLRTPLVMRYPALLRAGHRVHHPVEMVDLIPTVLELMGLPPMPGIHGHSMVSTIFGSPALEPDYLLAGTGDAALRMGPFKQILGPSRWLLFNLRADPGEREDHSLVWPVAERACIVRLGEGLAVPVKASRPGGLGPGPPTGPVPPAVIPPPLRKQLEALGYVQ